MSECDFHDTESVSKTGSKSESVPSSSRYTHSRFSSNIQDLQNELNFQSSGPISNNQNIDAKEIDIGFGLL